MSAAAKESILMHEQRTIMNHYIEKEELEKWKLYSNMFIVWLGKYRNKKLLKRVLSEGQKGFIV